MLGLDSEVPQDRFEPAIAMPRQDLSRTHLAHHELESVIIIIIVIIIIVVIINNNNNNNCNAFQLMMS